VATATAAVLAVGGFIGVATVIDPGGDTQVASKGPDADYLEVPDGELEITRGVEAEVPWLLSISRDGSCVTFTLGGPGSVVGSGACPSGSSQLDISETRYGSKIFVAGDVASDVSSVEMRAATVEGGDIQRSLYLHAAPADLSSDRRFFVSSVPADAYFAMVVGNPESPRPVLRPVVGVDPGRIECFVEIYENGIGDDVERLTQGIEEARSAARAAADADPSRAHGGSHTRRSLERIQARVRRAQQDIDDVTVEAGRCSFSRGGEAHSVPPTEVPAVPRGKPQS
jgi:hypothetical protein